MTEYPDFKRMINSISIGAAVIPRVVRYLADGRFPEGLSVELAQHSLDFGPDGWFHPSTHPLWPERMLWYYKHHPSDMQVEPGDYMRSLSVTMGSLIHSFMQQCLRDEGLLLTADQMMVLGLPVDGAGELVLVDEATCTRGKGDGVLSVPVLGERNPLFEFKTSNGMKLRKIDDMDTDAFIRVWPEYYAQVQEYMRMSGIGVTVVLVMALGYPWEMREFHIERNVQWQVGVVEKYQAALGDDLPMPCCGPRSKEAKVCPARAICPVGRA